MQNSAETNERTRRGLISLVAEVFAKLGKFLIGLIGFAVCAYVVANPDLVGSLRYLVVVIGLAWGLAWFYFALPRAPQIPVPPRARAEWPKPVSAEPIAVASGKPSQPSTPDTTSDVVPAATTGRG